MTDNTENTNSASDDDMSKYLQTFLDETEEQLDDLVETVLALETEPENSEDLNEAFRLIHSIKGSAGMMGLDNITLLTHHLENRFEQFRSGRELLDKPTMDLVLRCIDFLRQCNSRLRAGEELGSSSDLLDELRELEEAPAAPRTETVEQQASPPDEQPSDEGDESEPSQQADRVEDGTRQLVIQFRADLQLADLKAQLIVARLAGLGDVKSTVPDLEQFSDEEPLERFELLIATDADIEALQAAANVDGVESIELDGVTPSEPAGENEQSVEEVEELDEQEDQETSARDEDEPEVEDDATPDVTAEKKEQEALDEAPAADQLGEGASSDEDDSEEPKTTIAMEPPQSETELESAAPVEPSPPPSPVTPEPAAPVSDPEPPPVATRAAKTSSGKSSSGKTPAAPVGTPKVAETMRVDIDRLDNLMNLTGELVVNRARFAQISEQMSPELRKASIFNRVSSFRDQLQRTIENMENDANGHWFSEIQQLREGLDLMAEQAEIWSSGRQCFTQISDAVDQLSRVSQSLQRCVLDTRMVPVGPLFNRFRRVVRDISTDRGKKVNFVVHGEGTELDKRMVDELNEPLVHLVRNSIDHGLEAPDVRASRGKPEAGEIVLEASRRGNNVHITVRDDGGGIDADRIRYKLIENGVLDEAAAHQLSDAQALEYIWHPGFSTARQVTDVSGRGVGMDVVKTRINKLNGTIEVDSAPQQGTTFTIRLPLTLAIVNSLLVRLRNVVFSLPVDDVREIVSVAEDSVVTVHGRQTIDVRDEYLALTSIDEVFQWHGVDYGYNREAAEDSLQSKVDVVILQSRGKTLGLRVDELLGSQDIVIKSLSENFIDIPGLSGASILGDGAVCLMLDVGTVIEMAMRPRQAASEESPT